MYNNNTLYKRNAYGEPIFWSIELLSPNILSMIHGKVGGNPHVENMPVTMKSAEAELESRINKKRKEGYRYVTELRDNTPDYVSPEVLNEYLKTYLPKYNSADNGNVLPMLAKTLEDNKPFDKFGNLLGQYKINGVRCIVGIKPSHDDMFKPFEITYQSREGTTWKLPLLDDYILFAIPGKLKERMIDEGLKLDGELYIPGYSVNEINSAVKNPNSPLHSLLQYWIYDVCTEDMTAVTRYSLLEEHLGKNYKIAFNTLQQHISFEDKIVLLPTYEISDFEEAISYRDNFIDYGFEGLILRNPNSEYLFGKRSVLGMYKFKKKYDGYFKIIDIIPEGTRQNLPKFICKNDINDEDFEVTLNAPQSIQEDILKHKDDYIFQLMAVEFRERSGVKEVPFHAKGIKIIKSK